MAASVRPMMQTDRIKALADGVLAIVLTILVLNFEVPEHRFGHDALIDFFRALTYPFIAYVVTFGIVAAYWVQHSSIFHYVKVGDRTFVWLNILFLLPVSMLPFLTLLRATYHNEYVTTLLYACANIICGMLLYALWSYGFRHELMHPVVPIVDRSMRHRILLGIGINMVGAAVALASPHLSSFVFMLLPSIYLSHAIVDSHWNDEESAASGLAPD